MATYIITRHPATVQYLKEVLHVSASVVTHADDAFFSGLTPEDEVLGILPAPLMAQVCSKTCKPFGHFEIALSPDLRGKELSLEDLQKLKPCIVRYMVVAT